MLLLSNCACCAVAVGPISRASKVHTLSNVEAKVRSGSDSGALPLLPLDFTAALPGGRLSQSITSPLEAYMYGLPS